MSSSKISLSTRLYEWTTLQKSLPKCVIITAGNGINKFFLKKNQLKNY